MDSVTRKLHQATRRPFYPGERKCGLGTRLIVTGTLVLKKMVRPRSQAVRIRIRVRLGSGDDMSTSECLGTSVMSEYGRIRSENDLLDQTFRDGITSTERCT